MPSDSRHLPRKFVNRGVNLRTSPDQLTAEQFRALLNVDSIIEGALRSRFGTFRKSSVAAMAMESVRVDGGIVSVPLAQPIHTIGYLANPVAVSSGGASTTTTTTTTVAATYQMADMYYGFYFDLVPYILASPNGLTQSGTTVTVTIGASQIDLLLRNPFVDGTVQVGDPVTIYGTSGGAGLSDSRYAGTFPITAILSPTQFQFEHTLSGLPPAGTTGAGKAVVGLNLFRIKTTELIDAAIGDMIQVAGVSYFPFNGTWQLRGQFSPSAGYYYAELQSAAAVVPATSFPSTITPGAASTLTTTTTESDPSEDLIAQSAAELLFSGAGESIFRMDGSLIDGGYSGNPLTSVYYRMSSSSLPFAIIGDGVRMSKLSSAGNRFKLGISAPPAAVVTTVQDYSKFVVDPFTVDDFDYDSNLGPWGTGQSGSFVDGFHSVGTSFANGVVAPTGAGSALQFQVPYESDPDEKQLVYAIVMKTAIMAFGVQEIDMSEIVPGVPATDEDYIHMWVNVDDPAKLLELRIMFDVDADSVADASQYNPPFWVANHFIHGLGTYQRAFARNFYWYSVRPGDLSPTALSNATTLQSRREALARATTDTTNYPTDYYAAFVPQNPNQAVSAQAQTGVVQWTELKIRRGQFTRVGGDSSRSWANVRGFALVVIPKPVIPDVQGPDPVVSWSGFFYYGGSGPDNGVGLGYDWRATYLSSITGSESNPSEVQVGAIPDGEGTTLERQSAALNVTSPADPQVDRIRYYRRGGTLGDAWRLTVTTPTTTAVVSILSVSRVSGIVTVTTMSDHPLQGGDTVQITGIVDTSFNTVATSTTIPANNQFTYSQFSLPDATSGSGQAQTAAIDDRSDEEISGEPTLKFDNDVPVTTVDALGNEVLEQPLPCIWGPFGGTIVFGCGDRNRPGYAYWCNPTNPDAWSSVNNVEVTQPSDPLQNGFYWNGSSYVFSQEGLNQLLPTPIGGNQFSPVPVSVGRGLYAKWGLAAGPDTVGFWWVAKDGVFESGGGMGVSITDEDLYPLFHGDTVEGNAPIDWTQKDLIRLSYFDRELRFTFMDTLGTLQTWAYHIYKRRWRQESYPFNATVFYAQPNVTSILLAGGLNGHVYQQDPTLGTDDGAAIHGHFRTGYNDDPDPLRMKEYGSIVLDMNPALATINVQSLLSGGKPGPGVGMFTGSERGQFPGSLEDTYAQSIAFDFDWTSSSVVTFFGYELVLRADELGVGHFEVPASSYGLSGWAHIYDGYITVRSTADVTLTMVVDGVAITPVTIQATGGQRLRRYVQFSVNKGKQFQFILNSPQAFRLYREDSFMRLMPWGGQASAEIRPFEV